MIVPVETVALFLNANHYLGAARRGFAWSDEHGVLVLASPTSRHLPTDWLELSRWCLVGGPNAGSQQWAQVSRWLRSNHEATTVVSYSDPSVGHTGALYQGVQLGVGSDVAAAQTSAVRWGIMGWRHHAGRERSVGVPIAPRR